MWSGDDEIGRHVNIVSQIHLIGVDARIDIQSYTILWSLRLPKQRFSGFAADSRARSDRTRLSFDGRNHAPTSLV
jgi:hypothetical protein